MPASTRLALMMTLGTACAALAAGFTASLPARAGEVEVRFVEPDKFADAGRNIRDRERTMKSLAEFLQSLGHELPAGQTLLIEVKDIDLAGTIEPYFWRRFDDVRVLRGSADWPHLSFSYALQAEGRTLKTGDAHLADMSYMYSLRGRERSIEQLPYEKQMVRRWFDETFAAPR